MDKQITLAKAFDNSDMAFCVIKVLLDENSKPYDWQFVYLNDALAKLEGVDKQVLLEHSFFEIFPQADPKWFDYYYPAAYENKSFIFDEISEEIGLYLRIHCFPVELGYCGCILEDIKELHDSFEKNIAGDKVIQGLAQGYDSVWLVKAANKTVQLYQSKDYADAMYKKDIGSPYDEVKEYYCNRYVHPDDRQFVMEETAFVVVHEELLKNGIYEIQFRNMIDGQTVYYQFTAVAAKNSDDFVIAFRNINEIVDEQEKQKTALEMALASAEHANRCKTVFLSNMSHDIRTPMNAIMGFTTLALTHLENTDLVKDYLTKISTSSNHLLSLINDILDMSRIESGRMHLDEVECDLSEVLHDLRNMLLSDLKRKNLNFFIDTVDVYDEKVLCDKLRLNQILLNVVGNAMKFTNTGGCVSVRLLQKPGPNKKISNYEFRVKDTGIGMSKEFIEHIFEPFERERTSTVSGIQGTGLGMPITKNIVDMLGGTIEIESEKGVGTEFIITLPLKKQDTEPKNFIIEELEGAHALVVDDDFNTCDSVSNMMIQMGMRTDWCMSGKEAVLRCKQALTRRDPYRVYIIDWLIPDMNGVEIARNIRRVVGEEAPIVILTSYDWGDIEDEARAAGVNAFIGKPLFISDIRRGLLNILHPPKKTEHAGNGVDEAKIVGKRILLVEDNELNREIATELLSDVGMLVEEAEDGTVAVQKLQEKGAGYYDVVLMDIQMPVMDGYTATKLIRNFADKKLSHIPVIAMTANAFEEDKQKAIDAGMNRHVAKPIEMEKLLSTIEAVL